MGYLRQHQIDEIENEKRVIENTLDQNSRAVQDRGNLQSHLRRIDTQLNTQAPPECSGEDRDRMVKENREIEARLVPGMPSDEEMRRNPPGVVGRHMRHEKRAKSKDHFKEGDLARWKNNQLTLNKGDEDPDIANFERLRPIHNMGSMQGAQIPGTQYFGTHPSPAYLDGYDETFGKEDHQLSSAEPELEDESPELEDESPEPRMKVVRRTKKKSSKAKRKTIKKMTACGREMAVQGMHFHVKHCETCQEAVEE